MDRIMNSFEGRFVKKIDDIIEEKFNYGEGKSFDRIQDGKRNEFRESRDQKVDKDKFTDSADTISWYQYLYLIYVEFLESSPSPISSGDGIIALVAIIAMIFIIC